MIQIFDTVNGKPVPSVHCQFIKPLKDVIEFYPDNHLQVLAYILYTTCHDPTLNPYMNQEESTREDVIIADIGPLSFSLECPILLAAVEKCKQLYETPVLRNYLAVKQFLDKVSLDLIDKELTYGKNGNADTLKSMAKDSLGLWKTYKEFTIELLQEQAVARGKVRMSYDMMPGYRDMKQDNKDDNVMS